MQLVIIESPYAGEIDKNTAYARQCMRDCLDRGEAPYASHLLYTQPGILDDSDPDERTKGIEAGLCWGAKADKTAVYVDRGISKGMLQGIERAIDEDREIVFRSLSTGERYQIEELAQLTQSGYPTSALMRRVGFRCVDILKDLP